MAIQVSPSAATRAKARAPRQTAARKRALALRPQIARGAVADTQGSSPVADVVGPVAGSAASDTPRLHLPRTPPEHVERLIAGEAQAYEELVRQHGPMMLAVATRYLHRSHDAEDAVQDALLNVFRSISRFKRESRIETWLHRIVANCALMRLRTQRRKPHHPLDASALEWNAKLPLHRSAPLSAHEVVAQAETSVLLQSTISRLPSRERQILRLREIFTLEMGQVAEVLDLGPSTVRVTAHRARLLLQRELRRVREHSDATLA
jgi:RNA polymerase sigma-70 factor (ECF subfamily)